MKVWIDDAVEQNDGNDKPEDETRRRGDAETRGRLSLVVRDLPLSHDAPSNIPVSPRPPFSASVLLWTFEG